MMIPTAAKASPTRKATGSVSTTSGDVARPNTAATARMAAPESHALLAAHMIAPATTSSLARNQLRRLAQIAEHRRDRGGVDEHRVAGALDARRETARAFHPRVDAVAVYLHDLRRDVRCDQLARRARGDQAPAVHDGQAM